MQCSSIQEQKKCINIYHEQDFSLSAKWHLLATSNGTGPADGIGGTVKRLAAKRSLQKVYNNQIQTCHELFNYCISNIHNMTFFYIQEQYILNYKKEIAGT
jgi:hypothetical protein